MTMLYTKSQIQRLSFKAALACCSNLEIDADNLSRVQKKIIRDAIVDWLIEDPEGYSNSAADRLDRKVNGALVDWGDEEDE